MKTILTALLLAAFLNPLCPCLVEKAVGGEIDHCDHSETPAHGEDEPTPCGHSDAKIEFGTVSIAIPKWTAEASLFEISPIPALRCADFRELVDPRPPSNGAPLSTPVLTGVFRL